MTLAIFDLDNTLIAGDSDHGWGEFLADRGKVDGEVYRAMNEKFYQDYQHGRLDIGEYLAFALEPLARLSREELDDLHRAFMAEVIEPLWLPRAVALVESHRQRGHRLMVITSTNRFIVEPICQRLGIADLLATELVERDGRYTGAVDGVPTYQEGKVIRLKEWLVDSGEELAGSYFYSDSINDLPLLEVVDNPVAVDPDERLAATAAERGWPVITLRDEG
ncbi:MAG: HAD-IB family hydrolase [Porticoccaceae bacterium]|jgi:HAD superfamily hydrolase (TIGR01490 family)|nr:HAD-IB family hydrolase [Porticoccaceae bacterium]